ncbi:hypothetical protein [Streptomyces sp. NPDC002758]
MSRSTSSRSTCGGRRSRRRIRPSWGRTPTARQFAETQARLAAEDRYHVPETREELLAMRSADQNRTFVEHRETYDRLMHRKEQSGQQPLAA